MKQLIQAATIVALAVPALAFAQPVSSGPTYEYIEGGYVGIDSANGFGLGASLGLGEMAHIQFGFSHVTDSGLDVNATTVTGGVHYPISGTTDWVANAGFARASVEFGFGDASENGFVASTGLRSMVSPSTEISGLISYADTFSGETSVSVGVAHYFNDRAAVTGSLSANDGDFGYAVGIRFGF